MTTISESVVQIDGISSRIATSEKEQNAVADSINSSFNQMIKLAIENSSSVQQTSQAGNDLARMASELLVLMEHFQHEQEIGESGIVQQ
ncbi:MAG: hypothetical protein IIC58_09420 [Proteobacteria bacterium]|nr:hypothetical protein [Pseudomonadota bacterium]